MRKFIFLFFLLTLSEFAIAQDTISKNDPEDSKSGKEVTPLEVRDNEGRILRLVPIDEASEPCLKLTLELPKHCVEGIVDEVNYLSRLDGLNSGKLKKNAAGELCSSPTAKIKKSPDGFCDPSVEGLASVINQPNEFKATTGRCYKTGKGKSAAIASYEQSFGLKLTGDNTVTAWRKVRDSRYLPTAGTGVPLRARKLLPANAEMVETTFRFDSGICRKQTTIVRQTGRARPLFLFNSRVCEAVRSFDLQKWIRPQVDPQQKIKFVELMIVEQLKKEKDPRSAIWFQAGLPKSGSPVREMKSFELDQDGINDCSSEICVSLDKLNVDLSPVAVEEIRQVCSRANTGSGRSGNSGSIRNGPAA